MTGIESVRRLLLAAQNTYTPQCSEGITRNSVEMEFHPFQSKEPVSKDPFLFRENHGAERDKGGRLRE